jgi:2-phosphosulfolactate phosphatase
VTYKIDVAFRQEDACTDGYGAAAVIDTLRATTTMTVLLERGAVAVRPVADLEEAYALRRRDDDLLLGGERHNRPPEGFDGGNSPYDWPSDIERVKAIPRLILAALINADAAGRYLLALERPALLVASGAEHRASLEDVLAAGAVARMWPRQRRTDAAEMAVMVFESCAGRLGEAVRTADHGQDLIKLGLDDDLAFAAELNSSRVVPVLCGDGWLRAAD